MTGSAVVDAGICIDLRGMRGIALDPEARVVRAEGGLTWGELDVAIQEHGLAVTGGRVTDTGVAGLALAAAVAGWSASSGLPATTCSRQRWSPRMVVKW